MNVREALEKEIEQDIQGSVMRFVARVAPIIERALRTAYNEGIYDVEVHSAGIYDVEVHSAGNSDHGVTAGVAAMVEKS